MLPDAAGIAIRVSFCFCPDGIDLVSSPGQWRVTYEAGVLQTGHHLGGQGSCRVRMSSRG